jgi:hypothetical protein
MAQDYDQERLGELLRLLRPAPAGWVRAAQELPFARRSIDDIVARAEADAEFRQTVLADLEAALAREGVEPDPRLLHELERRLAEG